MPNRLEELRDAGEPQARLFGNGGSPTYNCVKELADQHTFGSLVQVPGHHFALVFAPDEFLATVRSSLAAAN